MRQMGAIYVQAHQRYTSLVAIRAIPHQDWYEKELACVFESTEHSLQELRLLGHVAAVGAVIRAAPLR